MFEYLIISMILKTMNLGKLLINLEIINLCIKLNAFTKGNKSLDYILTTTISYLRYIFWYSNLILLVD